MNMITENLPKMALKQEEMIDNILQKFNFEKVQKYMKEWKWVNGEGPDQVPTMQQLKGMAKKLLLDVTESSTTFDCSSGGFSAVKLVYANQMFSLQLYFSIEQCIETVEL